MVLLSVLCGQYYVLVDTAMSDIRQLSERRALIVRSTTILEWYAYHDVNE